MIASFKGLEVAVALDWRTLSKDRSVIKAAAEGSGKTHGIVLRRKDLAKKGAPEHAAFGLADDTRPIPSAAAWIAKSIPLENFFYADRTDSGQIWVCVIQDGVPFPGTDALVDEETARLMALQFLADPAFKLVSSLPIHPDAKPECEFGKMVVGKPEKLSKLTGGIPKSSRFALMAAATVGLLYFGHQTFDGYQKTAKLRALSSQQAEQERAQREAWEAKKRNAIKEAEQLMVDDVFSTPSTHDMISAWMNTIYSLPLVVDGWIFDSAKCKRDECETLWKRKWINTAASFRDEAGRVTGAEPEFRAAGTEAIIVLPVVQVPSRVGGVGLLKSNKEAMIELLSAGQSIELVGVKMVARDAVERKLPVRSLDNAVVQEEVVLPWRVGTLTVDGSHYYELGAIMTAMTQPYAAAKSIHVENVGSEKQTIKMEMTYATK